MRLSHLATLVVIAALTVIATLVIIASLARNTLACTTPDCTTLACTAPACTTLAKAALTCTTCVIPAQSTAALAEESRTLKKIQGSGTITLGYRESSVPFSYYDDDRQVIGYSQDLVQKIIPAINAELKLPKLDVKLVPITPENRFEQLRNGTIDLECGSTGHTLEREQQAAFSNTIFIVNMRVLTRKDYGIKDFADLAGKNVVTTAGTTNVSLIQKMNDEKKMGMNIIIAKDHRESFLTLETKRASAFLMDDVLLYGERIRAIRPGDWIITGTPQSREAYACILRKDDPQFKKIVDQAIAAAMTSGEVDKLYAKWFLSPIPPKGINLDFPMSADMVQLVKAPNDKAFR